MDAPFLKRLLTFLLPAAGLALLVVSLYLLSVATQRSADFGVLHPWLLLFNVAGVIALAIVIGANLFRLIAQYRSHVTGSRLTARLVAIFVLLAFVPASLVYYFSLQFLNRGIDSWFDVRVEAALDDALSLSRTSLDLRVAEARTRVVRCTLVMPKPPSVFSSVTAAVVSIDSGLMPASSSWPARAIEKQPAWAAPISSSGFEPLSSPKRLPKL
jgi:nitrogen fixation/metabolism regulation signal transduction histidine kinase